MIMSAVLHFMPDNAQAATLVAAYRERCPRAAIWRSRTAAGRPEPEAEAPAQRAAETYSNTVAPFKLRTAVELATLFAGFELVEPGVVYCAQWHPDPGQPVRPGAPLPQICALGRNTGV